MEAEEQTKYRSCSYTLILPVKSLPLEYSQLASSLFFFLPLLCTAVDIREVEWKKWNETGIYSQQLFMYFFDLALGVITFLGQSLYYVHL